MNYVSTSAVDRRQTYRLAIHHHSRIVLALDGPEPDDGAIHGVTLTDISRNGLMAADAGHLVPGIRVLLEVPLVGWREAEVRWIADNRAGCRFCEPLTLNELRLAAASSERLAGECPALAETIARMPSIERSRSMADQSSLPETNQAWRTSLLLLAAIAALSFLSAIWLMDHIV